MFRILLHMKHPPAFIVFVCFYSFACTQVQGQVEPQAGEKNNKEKQYKNVIRYDLSGGLFMSFSRYIVFGYERVLNKNQSFSINVGPVALPESSKEHILINDFTLRNNTRSNGFNVSVDYRFYLAKENKHSVPRGIYLGPYVSYNKFFRESVWNYTSAGVPDKTINTTLDMKIFSLGGELGYQFVLWNRIAIDILLIGPGIANYTLDLTASSNLSDEERERLGRAVKRVITERYVGLNYLLSNKEFDQEGTIKTWGLGYRYIIHIGYLFGK